MRLDAIGAGRTAALREERAKAILAFLCMPVPRGIVVRAIATDVSDEPVPLGDLLPNLLRILHEVGSLKVLTLAHVLALVATGGEAAGRDDLGDPCIDRPLTDYVEAAEQALRTHPQLRRWAAEP